MRTGLITSGLLAGALLLTGCGKKHDKIEGKTGADITAKSSASDIGEAYINELTRVADALETVKDEDSAKTAAVQLKVAVDGLNAMQDELGGKMDSMRAMQIFGGHMQEFAEVQTRIATSIADIQTNHPELMETISDELDRLKK
ncbi:MAG TPA: hypothetical protein PLR76_13370 [Hyphomonas sp.]|nr:hypothetical protein [Hyphomonas sp.]MCA8905385.1 hypothetical protein [Hyphomonas sp.]MCB9972175.1 hypothetical protein [Hyphomonas sp.]HPE49388.1 hypothetical protein [Hyphomonas sp.]